MKYAQLVLLLSVTTTQLFSANLMRNNDAPWVAGTSLATLAPFVLVLSSVKQNARRCAELRNWEIYTQEQARPVYSREAIESFRKDAEKQLRIEAIIKNDGPDQTILDQKKEKVSYDTSRSLLLSTKHMNNRRDTKSVRSQWNNHQRYIHSKRS